MGQLFGAKQTVGRQANTWKEWDRGGGREFGSRHLCDAETTSGSTGKQSIRHLEDKLEFKRKEGPLSQEPTPKMATKRGGCTCDPISSKRYIALGVACLAKLVAGSTSVFSIYANSLKKTFNYSQTEVAVVAAMHIVGTNLVLPAGIIYDKFGPLCTNIIGFVLSTLGYGLVYSAVLQPDYYSTRSSLFSFYFFIANHGVLYMYMASLLTSVKNFPPKHRAKVVALLDTMYGSGLMVFFSLYSEFYINGHEIDVKNQDLSGFLLTLLLVTATTYILCIFFLRIYPCPPLEDDEGMEMEQRSDSPSLDNLLEEEGTDDAQTTARESHPRAATKATEDEKSQWEYVKSGLWRTFFSIKFQCLMWAFVLLASTTGMFINNLTAMTKSVHLTHYNWPFTMAISAAGIVMRFVLSPLSDYLYPKVPRIVFLIAGDMLSVISYLTLLFTLDEFAGVLSACIMVGVSIASSYTFGTTILSEHFGTAHLGLHFGIVKIFDAVSGFGMQTAFGEIYDGQISNATSGTKDCYGVHCGAGQMGLAALVTTFAVFAAIGFLIKQIWDRRRRFST